METMRYREEKKSHKLVIFVIFVFLLIGCGVLVYAVKNEHEPQVVGTSATATDTQSLVDVNSVQASASIDELNNKTYEVKDNTTLSDSSVKNFKANIKIPVISIDGVALDDINNKIKEKYSNLYNTLKNELPNQEHSYTYTVTYNKYDNVVGDKRILSITIYDCIKDNEDGGTTYDDITTYNINFKDNKELKSSDVVTTILGSAYKSKIKDGIKNYADNYTYTGLEEFYIKDGKFHMVFNKGELVNKYVDITIE